MAISESKKKIVVDNYFKRECDINTSIKEAFTKGFELGLKKAPIPRPKIGHWITTRTFMHDGEYYCDKCKCDSPNNEKWDYCPNCGCRMVEPQERSDKE